MEVTVRSKYEVGRTALGSLTDPRSFGLLETTVFASQECALAGNHNHPHSLKPVPVRPPQQQQKHMRSVIVCEMRHISLFLFMLFFIYERVPQYFDTTLLEYRRLSCKMMNDTAN